VKGGKRPQQTKGEEKKKEGHWGKSRVKTQKANSNPFPFQARKSKRGRVPKMFVRKNGNTGTYQFPEQMPIGQVGKRQSVARKSLPRKKKGKKTGSNRVKGREEGGVVENQTLLEGRVGRESNKENQLREQGRGVRMEKRGGKPLYQRVPGHRSKKKKDSSSKKPQKKAGKGPLTIVGKTKKNGPF